MSDIASVFGQVLDEERQLALRADVDGLAAIQDKKRELLSQLSSSDVPEREIAELKLKALTNVQLIRHLVACLQGLSAPPAPTYTAGGARPSSNQSRSWGRL